MKTDFDKQMKFIHEIDKMKSILRNNKTFSTARLENDAEHSWHICVMALTLMEYADCEVDIFRVIKMLLIHDLVEIYAGDVIVYKQNTEEHHNNELSAAKRIFGILPEKQSTEFFSLWQEFEKRETNDAKFARAIDRLEPIMQIHYQKGDAWVRNKITSDRIFEANKIIGDASQRLWEYAQELINECIENGYIK